MPGVDLYLMADAMFDLGKIAAADNLVFSKKKMNRKKEWKLYIITYVYLPMHSV